MSEWQPTILPSGEARSDDQIMADHEPLDEQPLVIMELMQRFLVRDVMRSGNIISATRDATMGAIKELMRANRISGVPVLEDRRLFGMVSVNQIVKALEGGWLDDPCRKHMTTSLIVLEEDMPLTFALKAFQNYAFGRFPVLNKEHEFVGIISQSDVTRALLKEMSREISKLEGRTEATNRENEQQEQAARESARPYYSMRQFVVLRNDLANAGKAANEIKRMLKDVGVDARTTRRIAVAAYELEINVCIHSLGGTVTFILDQKQATVIVKDRGPGIADIEWACQDGTSTANDWIRSMGFGAGMGLANARRVADDFKITSTMPTGTTVICEFNLP